MTMVKPSAVNTQTKAMKSFSSNINPAKTLSIVLSCVSSPRHKNHMGMTLVFSYDEIPSSDCDDTVNSFVTKLWTALWQSCGVHSYLTGYLQDNGLGKDSCVYSNWGLRCSIQYMAQTYFDRQPLLVSMGNRQHFTGVQNYKITLRVLKTEPQKVTTCVENNAYIRIMLNYMGEYGKYCDACQAAVTVIRSSDAALNPTYSG